MWVQATVEVELGLIFLVFHRADLGRRWQPTKSGVKVAAQRPIRKESAVSRFHFAEGKQSTSCSQAATATLLEAWKRPDRMVRRRSGTLTRRLQRRYLSAER